MNLQEQNLSSRSQSVGSAGLGAGLITSIPFQAMHLSCLAEANTTKTYVMIEHLVIR
jgi:hypothetical protein